MHIFHTAVGTAKMPFRVFRKTDLAIRQKARSAPEYLTR
jgi:hypothetical protein